MRQTTRRWTHAFTATELPTLTVAEAGILDTAQATLIDIASTLHGQNFQPFGNASFDQLHDTYQRLQTVQDRCERLATTLQHALHAHDGVCLENSDKIEFHVYLYHALDITYLIFSDVAEYCELLQHISTHIEPALATTG